MTAAERIEAARALVAEWAAKELAAARDAERTADLDRAATYARIARAIELGVEEPTWTGWSWAQGRLDADQKLERARDRLRVVELATEMVEGGMAVAVGILRPREGGPAGGEEQTPGAALLPPPVITPVE